MKIISRVTLALIFCLLFLPTKTFAQYTDSYTNSYTDSYTADYTNSYTDSYTGGYEGGYENGYTGTYSNPAFQQIRPTSYCNGTISTDHVEWGTSAGAGSYEVYYLDGTVPPPQGSVMVDSNSITSALGFNMTPAQGLIEGHGYGYVVAAVNPSGTAIIAYSDGGQWSHNKYGALTQFPVCSPPPPPTLSMVTNQCVNRPGTDDNQFTFTFSSSASGIIYYHLDRDGVYYGSTTPGNPYIDVFHSPGESHTYTARVQTTPGTSTSSNSIVATGATCNFAPSPPTLSVVTDQCVNRPGLDDNQITFNFTSGAPSIMNYHLDRDGVYLTSTTPGNPYIDVFLTTGETHNYTARVQNPYGTSTASNNINVVGDNCQIPVVTYQLYNPPNTYTYPGNTVPFVAINQNVAGAKLIWNISNATSATTSWGQAITLSGGAATGEYAINTTTPGNTVYNLNVSNAIGPNNGSIQVNILKYPVPFIQTTGGDVHTNESIYITPNPP